MKKIFALLAVVLAVVSCQKEINGLPVDSNNEAAVSLSVALPDDATRAAGADSALGGVSNVSTSEYDIRFILEVYNAAGELVKDRMVESGNDPHATFNFRLIPGRNYKFVVWADFVANGANCDLHYDTSAGLRNVQVVNARWTAIDETRDAYTAAVDVVNYSGSTHIPNIVLTRPFAKLRVVTNDIKEMISVRPRTVKVNYFDTQFYTTFDAFAEQPKDESPTYSGHELVVNLADDKYTGEKPDSTGVQTLFADYMFAKEGDRVKFTMDVVDNGDIELPRVVFSTDIPVNRNHLTTVYGPILTDANNITVTIDENFAGNINVNVWDGMTVTEPKKDDEGNYVIYEGSELAWIADQVNGVTRAGEAKTFIGETIKLMKDIDLGNEPWTPIGSNGKIFKGTFDGNNKKIANLVVNGYNNNAGLFGYTTDGEIKNLVIENAKVSGRLNVGVVAGTPYTSKYTKITIKGHVEVNGMAYVGGVGGKNAYANWTDITVNVDETSYVKANSIENDTAYRTYVGGVVGFNGEGGHSFKNITSNINVEGSTCDVGGLFGIAHYGNKFENCSCSGDVEIYAAEEAEEVQEIGGIAGVWNNGGADVVFTNCSFTGTLTTNIDVDFYYGGLIGKPYSETGTGKLIIDGYEMVANGLGVNDEGECLVTATEGFEYIAEQVNAGNEDYTEADIVLGGDIDLAQLAAMTRSSAVANNWTPIGTEENPFKGSFDGNGKTIKNLALVESEAKEGKAFIGFFGYAKNATIKNVTFENVYINIPCLDIDHSQGHIGAVAGSLEGTSTIENVTVKGDIQVYATQDANGASRVAVVAGGNSYGDVTMKNVHVIANEGSYLIANNNTGALAGQLQGKSVFENCSSNINVTVNKFFAGGIIGLAAGDQTFTNCHTTGNVAVVAGRAGRAHDQYRVGGIAGGWADGANKVCTLTNCSYTGKVSGKNSDGSVAEVLDYMGYVGRGYTLNGCQGSKVVIDGTEFVQKYDTAAEAGIYDIANLKISNKADLFWFAQMVNINKCTFAGQTVKLAADIDLNNEPWTPVGQTGVATFNGVFDGQNHTISNLNVNSEAQTGAHYSSGLFGWVESHTAGNGHIKNVKIAGATIVGHHNCGALVGYITQETALVENCHVTGATVTCTKANNDADGDKAGALIGNATVATPVKDCTAANSTVSAGRDAGQVIGAGKEANVTGCSATNVAVSANGTGTGANVRNEVIGRLL